MATQKCTVFGLRVEREDRVLRTTIDGHVAILLRDNLGEKVLILIVAWQGAPRIHGELLKLGFDVS